MLCYLYVWYIIYEDIKVITANRWPPTPAEKQVGKVSLLCWESVTAQNSFLQQYSIHVCVGEIIDENIFVRESECKFLPTKT